MATYNGARFLGQQLDSIAAQTCPPDELVVADDCSSDDTVAIVRAFATRAPFPVRLIRHPRNVGILENFYSAFEATTGTILFYCDQDDVWRADKIATMLAAFAAQPMLVMHQSEAVDETLAPLGRIVPGNRRYGRFRFPVDAAALRGFGHQMALRRPVLALMQALRTLEVGPDAGIIANLDFFAPFCASLLGDLVVLPAALVRFRRHAGATSPAGAPIVRAPAGRLARLSEQARYRIGQDAALGAFGLRMVRAAILHGLLPPAHGEALLGAFAHKAKRASALQAAWRDGQRFAAPQLLGMLATDLRTTGRFSNDAALRVAALGILACPRKQHRVQPAIDDVGDT